MELARIQTLEELFKQAIVYGRDRLGFDRLGLLLYDEKMQILTGTFGTDVKGNLRDEHYFSLMYHISVSDNGIGFEPQYVERIFGMFQRLHGRFNHEGSGICLAICKRIVEWHNGRITAQGAPDVGATFIATLPFDQE